jgi:hypothetical protein
MHQARFFQEAQSAIAGIELYRNRQQGEEYHQGEEKDANPDQPRHIEKETEEKGDIG